MNAYGVNPGITVTFLICTVFTVILAVFSYYLVEKPAQQLSKNILKKLRKS